MPRVVRVAYPALVRKVARAGPTNSRQPGAFRELVAEHGFSRRATTRGPASRVGHFTDVRTDTFDGQGARVDPTGSDRPQAWVPPAPAASRVVASWRPSPT